jgi:hypothetical protein
MEDRTFSDSRKEIKFSIFDKDKPIQYGALKFDEENLSTEQLNELFNNETVINNVTDLALTNCNIEVLPESIGNLTKLTVLRLHDPEIDNRQRNPSLNEKANSFKRLPSSLVNLKNLEELRLEQYETENKKTGIEANKHNIRILYDIFDKTIKVRSKPRIFVNNGFGGEKDLIRKRDKRRLLENNFKNLYNNYVKEPSVSNKPSALRSNSRRTQSDPRTARRTQSEPRTARRTRRTKRTRSTRSRPYSI